MATNREWAREYARQADADFDAYRAVESLRQCEPPVEFAACQGLLFLQMACEKLVKSHLCSEGTDPHKLQTSHAFIAGTLPVVLRHVAENLQLGKRHLNWTLRYFQRLAREIELLAPAVRRGGVRPDNCEYPWEDGQGQLHSPLDWSFAPSHLLSEPAGRTFLILIRKAIDAESG